MKKYILILGAAVLVLLANSCKKENFAIDKDPLIPKENARFILPKLQDSTRSYFIPSSNDPMKIPVGFTTVSDKDRTITFSYTSSDATQGTQYQGPASVTIPAGKAMDTLYVKGLFAGFASASQIDTLVIRITDDGSAGPSKLILPTKITLYLRQFCSEAAPLISMLQGNYTRTNELFGTGAYGPYNTTLTTVTPINATSSKIAVTNIWDTGWGPIEFILDWSNPANPTTTVVAGDVPDSDGGDLSSTYAGTTVAVRVHASAPTGTYSFCNQRIVVNMQLGISGLGFFGSIYKVTMER
ncbi:MAG: hypothetical protein WAT19_11805 [Ferruginibacter sp.]